MRRKSQLEFEKWFAMGALENTGFSHASDGEMLAHLFPSTSQADAAAADAAVDNAPGPKFEDEIPFSRKGLLKSLVWLIAWQTICLAFAIGMPILGYLAITRQGVTLDTINPLIVCVLAT